MGIRLLDCTLRDGGYVNNWNFGKRRIIGVINGLTSAKLDFVECGFLHNGLHTEGQSLYCSIEEIKCVLPQKRERTEYVVMMNSGEFDVTKLDAESDMIFGIRVVFHEHQAESAIEECKIIQQKGYRAFLQPMGTDAYSDKSLIELVNKANAITPYAFYFVDSLGVMNSDDVIRIALLIHNNLKSGIVMGFHSHNNLQLSFSNVQTLINMRLKRDLIVDGSTYGMGRGAGNLHTELIAYYLNENFDAYYNVDQILRVYDGYIRSLREEYVWGYSVPYYLAAIHKCHPNYGSYLLNRGTLPVPDMGILLSSIAFSDRRLYKEKLIEELYTEYLADKIDDTNAILKLEKELHEKALLLLGPGKSLINCQDIIKKHITDNKPIVISINHVLEMYPIDYTFFSNRKRFEERRDINVNYILTSNIKYSENQAIIVDYMTLCNQRGRFSDNSALMLLSLLQRLGCKNVSVAGVDGDSGNDYYQKDIQGISDQEWIEEMNTTMTEAIMQYRQHMDIIFITPSRYD